MSAKMNVLVHVCCAPCASYSLEKLINDGHEVTAYFYNPNIHPEEEYSRRLAELEKFAKLMDYPLVKEEDTAESYPDNLKAEGLPFRLHSPSSTGSSRLHDNPSASQWLTSVEGLENEPEGGKRCEICFRIRLERAVIYAKENSFDGFTTTLTISPHKNSRVIHAIGRELGEKHGTPFLAEDFKKQDGFKKSLELSQKYGLYRQNYCGCVYSFR